MTPIPKQEAISWLDILCYSTRALEPPERFFWWAGLSAISAIVKKNVWLDRFSYVLYPNIYVILVSARSGLRKGIPISYANAIVNKVGVSRTIAGRNSIQGIVKALSEQTTLESGMVISDAQAFLCTGELDSFIVEDPAALSILTDLYNTHENNDGWKNTLKNSPIEALKNPCITLLGASNEALLENVIQEKDMKGGFIARTFIIHERKRRSVNSLMYHPEGLITKTDLANALMYLKDVKGQFKLSDKVRKDYDSWYRSLEIDSDADVTGVMERIGDSVLKVSMLLQLSKGPSLEITLDTMTQSIEQCEGFLSGIRKITYGSGKMETAVFSGLVLKLMLETEGNEIERTAALKRLHPDVDAMMFDRVMDDFGEVRGKGIMKGPYRKPDKKIYYKLKEEVVEKYKKLGGKA